MNYGKPKTSSRVKIAAVSVASLVLGVGATLAFQRFAQERLAADPSPVALTAGRSMQQHQYVFTQPTNGNEVVTVWLQESVGGPARVSLEVRSIENGKPTRAVLSRFELKKGEKPRMISTRKLDGVTSKLVVISDQPVNAVTCPFRTDRSDMSNCTSATPMTRPVMAAARPERMPPRRNPAFEGVTDRTLLSILNPRKAARGRAPARANCELPGRR